MIVCCKQKILRWRVQVLNIHQIHWLWLPQKCCSCNRSWPCEKSVSSSHECVIHKPAKANYMWNRRRARTSALRVAKPFFSERTIWLSFLRWRQVLTIVSFQWETILPELALPCYTTGQPIRERQNSYDQSAASDSSSCSSESCYPLQKWCS